MQGHGLGQLGYRNESKSTTNASFATGCCIILKWLALAVLITRGRGSISLSPSGCRGGFRATRKQLRYAPVDCTFKTRLWQNYSVTDGHTVAQMRVAQTSPHSKSQAIARRLALRLVA